MKGDFTRLTFDPRKEYRGVLMQQGRLQLDSDWNEQVQICDERFSGFFSDFVGHSGGPQRGVLKITVDGGKASLGKGSYYVHGIEVENVSDGRQLPQPKKGDGWYLYYIDVWTREVTWAEDTALVETALGGADTAIRIKTQWEARCRFLAAAGDPVALSEPYAEGGWPAGATEHWQQPTGTGTMEIVVPASGGSLGNTDNRLYRVEVHSGSYDDNDKKSDPVLKWSRDNGSVVAPVASISGDTIILADSSLTTHNALLGARWIEVCDAASARAGRSGALVDMSTSVLTPGKITSVAWSGTPSFEFPAIIRRWDGLIPLPALPAEVELEKDGLKVRLSAGTYRCGDYWNIVLRSGAVSNWSSGEARRADGVAHHYAPLALVRVSGGKVESPDTAGFKDLRALFSSLTSYDVTTTGDVTIGGRLGVGFQDQALLKGGVTLANNGDQWSSWNLGCNLLVQPGGAVRNPAIAIFDHANANPWALHNGNGALYISQMPQLGDVATAPRVLLSIEKECVAIRNSADLVLMAKDQDAGDIIFADGVNKQKARIWSDPGGASGLSLSGSDNSADLRIGPSGETALGLRSGAKVGIATATPRSQLDIGGSIGLSSEDEKQFLIFNGYRTVAAGKKATSVIEDLKFSAQLSFDKSSGSLRIATTDRKGTAAAEANLVDRLLFNYDGTIALRGKAWAYDGLRIGPGGSRLTNVQAGTYQVKKPSYDTEVAVVKVRFPAQFATPPKVIATPNTRGWDFSRGGEHSPGQFFLVSVQAVTTSQCTFAVHSATGQSWIGIDFDWVAWEAEESGYSGYSGGSLEAQFAGIGSSNLSNFGGYP